MISLTWGVFVFLLTLFVWNYFVLVPYFSIVCGLKPNLRIKSPSVLVLFFDWCPPFIQNSSLSSNLYHFSVFFLQQQQKGGIISKIRRRLTVQGESETIDGGVMAELARGKGKPVETNNAEDVSIVTFTQPGVFLYIS